MHGDAAGRLARHRDDPRGAGQREHLAVGHLCYLGQITGAPGTLAHGVQQEPGHGAQPRPAHARLGLLSPARPLGVGGVHVDGNAVLAPEPLCEAEVVAVSVGQHHPADVREGAAQGVQLRQQFLRLRWRAALGRPTHGSWGTRPYGYGSASRSVAIRNTSQPSFKYLNVAYLG